MSQKTPLDELQELFLTHNVHMPREAVAQMIDIIRRAVKHKDKKEKPLGSIIWEMYAACYAQRYRVAPVRNAKTNALCNKLIEAVGFEPAQKLVQFYLSVTDQYLIQNCHPLEILLKDYQKYLTRMLTGRQYNQAEAVAMHNAELLQRRLEVVQGGMK